MSPLTFSLLFAAAALAGALNSIAGGGSFITFPMLLFVGVGPIVANATSTVALWPGSLSSAWAYRREVQQDRRLLGSLSAVSLVGGLAGAALLLLTPARVFTLAIPFLLLFATAVFTFGERLRLRLTGDAVPGPVALGAVQLLISVYGGYFGGGMGLMMLAAFAALGMTDLHRMNGLKSALGVLINGVAVVAFVVARQVDLLAAPVMIAGAVLGGWGGAALARRVEPRRVRPLVVVLGWAMTVAFFVKTFWPAVSG